MAISTAENDNLEITFDNNGITAGKYCNIFVKDDCIEITAGNKIKLNIILYENFYMILLSTKCYI